MNFKQSGVALITVILILALATVTAVSMASRQNIDIHRSSNILNYEQAYQYVVGIEDFAKRVLIWDLANDPAGTTDSLDDSWNEPVTAPIEGGGLKGEIRDLQACFNLNNLVLNGQIQAFQRTRFRRLLDNIGLDRELSEPIIDWIDADENVRGISGAEDNTYLNYPSAYRAANRNMSDVSELLLIEGIDSKIYQILEPHVCVINMNTDLNVNTADAGVISSIVAGVNLDDAKTLVDNRGVAGYASVNDFFAHNIFQGRNITANDRLGLSVNTDNFHLTSTVQVGSTQIQFITHLQRSATGVSVNKRMRSLL